MKSPKILLIGIGGVYNYGCEAIVRGTEAIIHRDYPDAVLLYASLRPEDDRARLVGCDIEIIPRKRCGLYSIPNVTRKIISSIGFQWTPRMDSLVLLNGVDAVFSIGGDIYTLNANGGYSMSFPKFGDASLKKGVPYVLWGASVGPFSGNPTAEKAYTKHLKKLTLITAREQETLDYLKKLGIYGNVIPCADPGFVVEPEIKAEKISMNSDLTIGINLSPLSVRYSRHSIEESIRDQAAVIERLIKEFNARVILIPHVVSDFNEGDDDRRYLRQIKQAIESEYQSTISLLDNDLGFVGVKRELIKCSLVIASRMHCAINALAAHIPTIFMSYSRKAVGMCRYVYGNTDWVLPIEQFAAEHTLVSMVGSKIEKITEAGRYLSTRIPEIQRDAHLPMTRLKNFLSQ